jgi:AcrR family transcriptional regulator
MTTRTATSQVRATPTGRDEVSAAVLSAAAELFAERGPAATSIRDIATRSKVNHGLIFRHFGAKDRLVGAVLDHLVGQLTELLDAGAPAADVDRAIDRHTRVMARALLDGYPAAQLQTSFPNIARLLDEVVPRYDDEAAARLAIANALALQIGWRLFGPFLRRALELENLTEAELKQAVDAEVARMVTPG